VFVVVQCSDAEAVDEDDVNDPEYNIMQEDADDDDDDEDEEIRNDKATRVSSMLTRSLSVYSFSQILVGLMGFSQKFSGREAIWGLLRQNYFHTSCPSCLKARSIKVVNDIC